MSATLSVITACYNHGRYLAECMASVRDQTAPNVEHIVVIDGATDDSARVALREKSDRCTVIMNDRNLGLAASQNIGIREAAGEWVLKVDADDRIAPTYCEEILRAADADPSRNVIFSPAQHFGGRRDLFRYPAFDPAQMIDTLMIAGCAAIRRDLWSVVGGHDETMPVAEDWDLYVRAQVAVGLVPYQLDDPLWFYRIHDGPRASARGIARLGELQQYWRGHTKASVLAGTRSWGSWCRDRGMAA